MENRTENQQQDIELQNRHGADIAIISEEMFEPCQVAENWSRRMSYFQAMEDD